MTSAFPVVQRLDKTQLGEEVIKILHEDPDFPAKAIRVFRKNKLKMTKLQLANTLGVSNALIESWECARRAPSKTHIKLLKILRLGLVQPKTMETL